MKTKEKAKQQFKKIKPDLWETTFLGFLNCNISCAITALWGIFICLTVFINISILPIAQW